MARYAATVESPRPAPEVFDYLAEFSNAAEWDPGVARGRHTTGTVGAVGARFEITTKQAMTTSKLVYEITEIDRPRRVVLRGDNAFLVSLDTITVEDRPGGGCAVTYDAVLTLKGPLKLLDPALALVFPKVGDKARDGLRATLAR